MSETLQVAAQTILTDAGRNALRDAELTGSSPKPKFFRASDIKYPLDSTMGASDFHGWYSDEIAGYLPVSTGTAQFTIKIDSRVSLKSLSSVGIFLEDGTLFGLSVLVSPLPAHIGTNLHILHDWDNINELLDFKYIPIEMQEEIAMQFDTCVTHGLMILQNTAQTLNITKIQGVKI